MTLPLELTGEVTAFDRPILADGSIASIAPADELPGLTLGTVDKLDLLDLGH